MNDSRAQTDILIVGAGPVGLALAAELRRLGAVPMVIDRQPEGANTSRAAVIHARTMEVLAPLGVTETLLGEGVICPVFRVRDRDRILIEIDFAGLPTPFPFSLMCPQNRTEAILRARLDSLGGTIERPVELVALTEAPDGYLATLRGDEGERRVRARWVVGCDGAHSVVRDHANVTFEGGTYDEAFVLADVEMQWPIGREEVSLFFSPEGLVVVAPLPEGRFRVVATADSAPESPDLAFVQGLLARRGPADVGIIQRVVWSSRFHIQHRVASRPRSGRILLCGDAAHVHSPAGGQGMNTGIQDAIALAPPLIDAVNDKGEEGLETWATRRHEIAHDVVALTDRLTRAATLGSPAARSLRNAALSIAGRVPGVPERVARMLAELDNR